jgi:hypothetical protein
VTLRCESTVTAANPSPHWPLLCVRAVHLTYLEQHRSVDLSCHPPTTTPPPSHHCTAPLDHCLDLAPLNNPYSRPRASKQPKSSPQPQARLPAKQHPSPSAPKQQLSVTHHRRHLQSSTHHPRPPPAARHSPCARTRAVTHCSSLGTPASALISPVAKTSSPTDARPTFARRHCAPHRNRHQPPATHTASPCRRTGRRPSRV